MSITFANAKNGCQGSGSSTSTPANTLSLFTSETTKGYNFYKNKSASNDNWEIAVFGRAHNYSSSAETYDYTIYVFGRKLNSATSHGDFKITFYYRDKSYSVTSSRYLQKRTGKVRLLASYTFDGLNCEPYTSTTIGAKVVGPSGTEASGTITATDTADFSGGASWSVYVQSDSSIKLEGTNLTTNRGFRHAWVWQWKRTSASSYTTDATTNCGADNTATSLSNTFSGLVRNTSYDVRARFYLRNYDPTDDTYNDPVPISSRTIVRTATTDKSDLSGSASLSGNRYVGGTLTVSVNNPDNAALEYQWCTDTNDSFTSNDGTQIVISGENSSSFVVPASAVDKYIYCKITFTKDNYNTKFVRKYTSGVVYRRDLSGSVTIKGSNKMNGTLTASVSTTSDGAKTYQWWTSTSSTATSGTNISGATSSTFKVTSSQIGKYIGVTVKIAQTDIYKAGTINDITSGTAEKIAPTVTAPTMKSNLNYSGSSLALINAGSVTGGTMYYYASTSDTTPAASSITSTSIPTGLPTIAGDAQTYNVWYKVIGSAGYTDIGVTKIGSVIVNPGTFTVTNIPYSGIYDGKAHKASIKVSLDGCVVKSGSVSGTYELTDSSNTTANTAIILGAVYCIDVGSGTVYYQVSKDYYKIVTGSTTIDINKATGSGSVTMNGWTYGETVPNPIPSSSTNGTSNITYTWYDSDKTQLSAKPTSSSNAGIYYVKAAFPATANYNAYTTDYVGFTVVPSISISISQDYLKGDYGVASGTISYSLGGGVGSCTNITLISNNVKIFDNATIAISSSIHPKKIINTTVSYSIRYKDYDNSTKTIEGSRIISFPYDKAFDYTYSHINASGVKTAGVEKDFVNDGTDPSKQFYLTATEWNDINKFLYSAAFRKNGWNSTGLTAPNVSNASNSQLTAAIYNSAVALAEKITGVTYNRVTSGSRITSKHFNGFRDIINANKITFILDGTTYTVENGTTWKHFSDENGLNCASNEDGVWDANYDYQVYNSSGQICKGGDVIVSDTYVWAV